MYARIIKSRLRLGGILSRRTAPLLYRSALCGTTPFDSDCSMLNSTRSYSFSPSQSPESELKEVLKSELKISKTIPHELDYVYTDYLNKSGFQVQETEGTSNVQLVKKENDETVRVFFDIDEVTDIPLQEEPTEQEDFNEEVESLDSLLCNVRVFVENTSRNNGMFLNLFFQNSESSFLIDFALYKSNANEFLKNKVASGEFLDKFQYQGPRFSDLDESLQTSFENYLDSKGINDELAEFIVSYSEYKEEKEYRRWLANLEDFLK